MALEDVMTDLTKALNANTAAILGNKGAAGAANKAPAGTAAAKKPKHTKEEVLKIAVEVKNKISKERIDEIRNAVCNVASVKDITDEHFDEFYDACETALKEAASSTNDI